MPEPLNPGHQVCASCWFYDIISRYCPALMDHPDPAFTCEDWRDCREQRDPAAMEPQNDV